MLLKLAWRNIAGGGFRSWLNVFIISVVLVAIVGFHGLFIGWQRDAETGMIKWHIGQGQYWHADYDPYDPFSFEKSRAPLPDEVPDGMAVEFIVDQGVIYPQGRMKNIMLKGVEEEQEFLELPTRMLKYEPGVNKMMLGSRTAKKHDLQVGDKLMLRWRDADGAFDAGEFDIVHIFQTTVQSIDQNQVWLGIQQLRQMLHLNDEVNYFSISQPVSISSQNFIFKTQDDLLAEFRAILATELAGGVFIYIILLFLAMIAVFDTQVLALFKRRKEVGMMMALGMRRGQIMWIFTLEGILSGVLAVALGAVWGTPLLLWFQKTGFQLPEMMDSYGMDGFLNAMYPHYTFSLAIITIIIVMIIITFVSYLPVRTISRLLPVDALRGKITRGGRNV